MSGGRAGIEALLHLLEAAFGQPGVVEDESQALLQNLMTVDQGAWRALPPGAARSIESIVLHVGSCKVMYAEYAFRGGQLQWDDPEAQPWQDGEAPMPDTLDWLVRVHGELVDHVKALRDDSELERDRQTNWGEQCATRSIIAAMITHDAYHAGEINHLRSMLGTDDRWRHVQLGYG